MQYKVSHLQTKPVRAGINFCNEGIIGVILSLTLLSPVTAQTSTFGVHTISHHDRGNFNNNNTGVYVENNGWMVGYYQNSLRRDSLYGGYAWHWPLPDNPVFQSAAMMAGVVSGYRTRNYNHDYSVMGAFSLKHDVTVQHGLRLSILPTHSKSPANYVLHLSYEYKLK